MLGPPEEGGKRDRSEGNRKCGAVGAETFSKDGPFGRLGTDNCRRKPTSLQVVLVLSDMRGPGEDGG